MQLDLIKDRLKGAWELTKPGISVFIGLTAVAGALLRKEALADPLFMPALFLAGYLSSAGSAAFNQYYEIDLDRLMDRTKRRPLPSGLLSRQFAFFWSVCLLAGGLAIALYFCSAYAAGSLAMGSLVYILFYTVLTKRRTVWNVPVGGFCGFFAALAGAISASGQIALSGLALAMILYFWSAPHFWSLAIVRRSDYQQGEIPMLPVVAGNKTTALAIVLHIIALLPLSFLLNSSAIGLAIVLLSGAAFAFFGVKLFLSCSFSPVMQEQIIRRARQTFLFSLAYLPLVFSGILLDVIT
jgi:protoheme IX farnesyltransferase